MIEEHNNTCFIVKDVNAVSPARTSIAAREKPSVSAAASATGVQSVEIALMSPETGAAKAHFEHAPMSSLG